MNIDWKALKPHIPLSPGATEYVSRTGSAGEEIANWILADRSPLLVGGPAGVGKSTELARAAELLQPDRVACLIQLDRFENMRHLTRDRMLLRIVQRLGYLAGEVLHLPLSTRLLLALSAVGGLFRGESVTFDTSPSALTNAMVTEVMRLSKQHRLTLLIDGLEKVPPGEVSMELFDTLAAIHEDVELVIIIPWHAAFGPQAETVIRGGERFVAVRAVDVDGDIEARATGRRFLRNVLLQRLGWTEDALDDSKRGLVEEAIRWSGGMPRTFLQLMADAGSYAKLRRGDPWPSSEDLSDACSDQVDSFRRLFLQGDTSAIYGAAGTSGSELALDRKIRLMAHGILLEQVRAGVPVVLVHPLAQAALDGRRPRA